MLPLHKSAVSGDGEAVRRMLADAPDSLERCSKETGSSLLHFAARGGIHALAVALQHWKASVDVRNGYGDTPLMHAAGAGQRECVHSLLEAGADAALGNVCGMTAAMCAAANETSDDIALSEVLTSLLAAGADINQADKQGRTALHHAATHGNLACVAVLLAHGADMRVRTADGALAIDCTKQPAISGLLKDHWAGLEAEAAAAAATLLGEGDAGGAPGPCKKVKKRRRRRKAKKRAEEGVAGEDAAVDGKEEEGEAVASVVASVLDEADEVDDSAKPFHPPVPSPELWAMPAPAEPAARAPGAPLSALADGPSYARLQREMEVAHPLAAPLCLQVEHLLGMQLSSLSMAQLEELQEIHMRALRALADARVDLARRG
eukprot:PLAT6895.2.p1 GENE.PLAT6895.2~~PLAT6895.2.p1  ORF type:complete len:384 (-),score=121.08 PLAT6895.2:845-1975(-)